MKQVWGCGSCNLSASYVLASFFTQQFPMTCISAVVAWQPPFCNTGDPHTSRAVLILLQNLAEVHFLDAGLNCRGAHVTDPQVITSLSRYVQQDSRRMTIHLHGTPRQWGTDYAQFVASLLVAACCNLQLPFHVCGTASQHIQRRPYCNMFGRRKAHPVCPSAHTTCLGVVINAVCCVASDKAFTLLGLDDSRRPWVEQEKERFRILLESNSLPVQEHRYFTGVEPTLLMHFEVIPAMRRCQLSV